MAIFDSSSLPADRAPIADAVFTDVITGLDGLLTPMSFALDGPFQDAGAVIDGDIAVVVWRFVGIDNGRGFNNLWPTAKRVTVRGVTIVDRSDEPWQFHRHIDWNGVNAQLGGSLGRSSAPIFVKAPEHALFYAADHYEFPEV
jgi:hypothetical protein